MELSIELKARIAQLEKDLKKARKELEKTGEAAEKSGDEIENIGLKAKKGPANAAPTLVNFSRIIQDMPYGIIGVGNNITATAESFEYLSKSAGGAEKDLKKARKELEKTGESAEKAGDEIENIGPKTKKGPANAAPTLVNFSRIIQDMPYGIIGVGNNITATAESFGYLSKSAGGAKGALKALGASFMGAGGLIFIISTAVSLLTVYGDKILAAMGSSKALGESLKETTANAAAEAAELKALGDIVRDTTAREDNRRLALEELQKKYPKYLSNLSLEKDGIEKVGTAIEKVTQLLFQKATAEGLTEALKKVSSESAEDLGEFQANVLDARKKVTEETKRLRNEVSAFSDVKLTGNLNEDLDQFEAVVKRFGGQGSSLLRPLQNYVGTLNNATTDLKTALKGLNEQQQPYIELLSVVQKDVFSAQRQAQAAGGYDMDEVTVTYSPKVEEKGDGIKKGADAANKKFKEYLQKLDWEVTLFEMGQVEEDWAKAMEFITSLPPIKLPPLEMDWVEPLNEQTKKVNEILEQGIVGAFENMAEGIGQAMAGNTTLAEGMFSGLLAGIGDTAVSLGKMVLAQGIAIEAFKKSLQSLNGVGAIAAGAALIAIGSSFKAGAASLAETGAAKGRNNLKDSKLGEDGLSAQRSSSVSNSYGGSSGGGTVVFEISGTKLVGVLNRTLKKDRRTVADVI